MVHIVSILSLSSLLLLVQAQEDAVHKAIGLARIPITIVPSINARSLSARETCSGTCAQCFGTGYTNCPGSNYYCYKPGDPDYGLDSCSGSTSVSATASASAPASTSTGSTEFCYQKGATCVSCFGAGYLQCSDGVTCYNPNDPQYDTCPESTSSGGSGSTSSSSCAEQYGSGSIPCGEDACYNPTEGDVCCADGYHCEGGYSCSTIVGKCCAPGSTKSGCSGTGGLLTSSTRTATSYSYPTVVTDPAGDSETSSALPSATTTRSYSIGTTSRVATPAGSTNTGTSQITDNSTGGSNTNGVYFGGVMTIAGTALGMIMLFL